MVVRLDALRVEYGYYDEFITDLVRIYGAGELTLFRGSDVD